MKLSKLGGSVLRISILMLIFLAGAGTSCSLFVPREMDSVLKPYVIKFSADMGIPMNNLEKITVRFKSLSDVDADNEEGSVIGRCDYSKSEVTIDPDFFYSMGTTERRRVALIHHELGHCYCYEGHNDSVREDGCPVSIMNSMLPGYMCLRKHWESYKRELKDRCSSGNLLKTLGIIG